MARDDARERDGTPQGDASVAESEARLESEGTRPSLDGSLSPPTTRRELLDYACAYARTIDLDVDYRAIDWEISERSKRRAGACRFDVDAGTVTILLTWRAYVTHGWSEMRRTIRHELVHAWEFQHYGEAGHGPRFREKAEEVDAPRYCRAFSEPRLRLVCRDPDCDWTANRHRAAKTVTQPERRRCGACGGEYEVRHVESGERWTTNTGYRAARERIGDAW